jgi:hypothetical protein
MALSCLGGLLLMLGSWLYAVAHHGEHPEAQQAPTETSVTPGSVSPAGEAVPPVAQLLEIYECTTCHRLTTPHRLIGPSLWRMGERADATYIRTSILEPDALVAPGYPAGLMRTRLQELGFYADIARQPAILERLVAYLAGAETPAVAVTDQTAATEGMLQLPMGSGRLPNGQAVAVPAFTIDRGPITTAQYAAFLAAGGYTTKRYWERDGWAVVVQRRKRTHPTDWEAQQRQAAEHPVVGVTWFEADAYCRWLGKTLPTEVQWERACQEVPEWHGPESHWEWTTEAVWKGGGESALSLQRRCASRVQSYPALEGQHTGFRCLARTHAESP